MHDYPEAYTADNLRQILDANDSVPSLNDEQFERLVELAERRASGRGESAVNTGLEQHEHECLIATNWDSFAGNEFGYDGEVNQFAFGVYDHDISAGKGACLFTDTVVVQNGYLTTGDGRKTQFERYMDEDYDNANAGEMWIPRGAQDYIGIVVLDPELLFGEADIADMM